MYPNKLGSKGRTIQAQINCDTMQDNLAPEIIEKYKNTLCQYCLLRDGDVLYFPAFWWYDNKL